MSLGFSEIMLILVVILLLFGANRIPELAKALGRASHEFKKAKESIEKESQELVEDIQKQVALEDELATKTTEAKQSSTTVHE